MSDDVKLLGIKCSSCEKFFSIVLEEEDTSDVTFCIFCGHDISDAVKEESEKLEESINDDFDLT